jgi:general secretion pathway protein G
MNFRSLRISHRRQGFTFIEIMLVVLIIGILMAAVVPNLVGRTRGARITVARQSLTAVETALATFEMNAGRFPTSQEGLQALRVRPADLTPEEWQGPYLKTDPLDPWNEPFVYRSPGEGGADFDLFSKGPDKREGTQDDVFPRSAQQARTN